MITVSNLHYQYGNSRKVLNGLHLQLEAGKIYGILGRNGAGKSTILKCISGLLIPKPAQIKIGDWDAKDRLPEFLAELFLLPEEISSPDIKPENYGKLYGSFYPRYDHALFTNLCTEFEIPIDQRMDDMSYGQKKKTIMAFGIACNTKLIILDEPTNGLDIPSKSQFRKMIARAIKPTNTILICTHQVKDVENLIEEVIVLNEGEIIFKQHITSITAKLQFFDSHEPENIEHSLYNEKSLRGVHGIMRNIDHIDTKIDLELLYKGVLANASLINHQFNH